MGSQSASHQRLCSWVLAEPVDVTQDYSQAALHMWAGKERCTCSRTRQRPEEASGETATVPRTHTYSKRWAEEGGGDRPGWDPDLPPQEGPGWRPSTSLISLISSAVLGGGCSSDPTPKGKAHSSPLCSEGGDFLLISIFLLGWIPFLKE